MNQIGVFGNRSGVVGRGRSLVDRNRDHACVRESARIRYRVVQIVDRSCVAARRCKHQLIQLISANRRAGGDNRSANANRVGALVAWRDRIKRNR